MSQEIFRVLTQVDVERTRRSVRIQAGAAGLAAEQAESWALVASELATNLVRHAKAGGQITLVHCTEGTGFLELTSIDGGPGISDVGAAMNDGFSTCGGLGCGLGLIKRLSDDMLLESSVAGTKIIVRKWLDS